MSKPYWRGAAEDEAMQEEHGFLWRALLDTIDIDLAGRRVLAPGVTEVVPEAARRRVGDR